MTSTQADAPLLSVRDLRIGVPMPGGPSRRLIDGISFDIGHGETVGFVGESGSGKSLTAKALVGLLPRPLTCSGSITFDGAELLTTGRPGFAAIRGRGISLLLQDPFTMLNPARSAGDHIIETLRTTHGREVARGANLRAEVGRRLREVGIDNPAVADRYPFELSGGMSQRVALAASLAGDPQLLVADEPTTALDTTTQKEILDLLLRIQQARQMSLVLISHDLNLAFSVCRRLLVMYAGSVVETAPSDELRAAPLHPYSADLMRSVPSATHYQPVLLDIAGTVPTVDEVSAQCGYASRCSHTQDPCLADKPGLASVGPDRESACVRIEELRREPDRQPELVTAPPDRTSTAQRPAVLIVKDLHKTYGRGAATQAALSGVSFEVHQAESVGIVGESGSGKTTIAKILLGLERASSGQAQLAGTDISDYRRLDATDRKTARRTIQCVFQDPYSSLNPLHTIGYALAEALRQREVPDSQRAAEAEALLERVGLPAATAARLPSALSGGQRQRVAIARSLAVNPQLLICDEPVAALDVSVQAQVLRLLRSVRDEGAVSLLFITHDLAVVRQVADRVIVLCRGEIVEQGATEQVLNQPSHDYTRRLIAAMP